MSKKKPTEPQMIADLRAAVESCELSDRELAAMAGVDQGQLSRFKRGERDLRFASAARLAEALGMRLTKPTRKPKP